MGIGVVRRQNLWFGTIEKSEWVATPNSGADSSPEAWSDDGTYLSGGGYARSSWDSNRMYVFEWPDSSSREMAQKIRSYTEGTFGRGLIYFQSPLTYDTNVLAPRNADPSILVGSPQRTYPGAEKLTRTPTASNSKNLPYYSAVLTIPAGGTSGFPGTAYATYVTIPDGYTLFLGAFYSATGTGGVFASPQTSATTIGAPVTLTAQTVGSTDNVSNSFASTAARGVWLWTGRTSTAASTVTTAGVIGRLVKTGDAVGEARAKINPWIGGQGNSGCRVVGAPTRVEISGAFGGQIGFACSFREVGAWISR